MLPRNRRVSTRLLALAMKDGKTFHSPHFMLRLSPYKPEELSRCAITISKKIDSRATERNLLRRKLSVYIEALIPTLPKGYILLISAKKGFSRTIIADCGTELQHLIHQSTHP